MWNMDDVIAMWLKVFTVIWLNAFYLGIAVGEEHARALLL